MTHTNTYTNMLTERNIRRTPLQDAVWEVLAEHTPEPVSHAWDKNPIPEAIRFRELPRKYDANEEQPKHINNESYVLAATYANNCVVLMVAGLETLVPIQVMKQLQSLMSTHAER